MWTKEQLSSFTGEPAGTAMYLAIVGEVYDVSRGDKFYSAVSAGPRGAGVPLVQGVHASAPASAAVCDLLKTGTDRC